MRDDRERDLDRELRDHLELEAEEQRASGLAAREARYAAQRALGNTAYIKEDVRQAWGWMMVEHFLQDVRYALRGMRKSPAFAATAVLSLALGTGANTAIFTVVNAVLLKPLPYPEPERLVQLWETKPSKNYFRNVVNPINFLDWKERTHSFEHMAAVTGGPATLTGGGGPVAVPSAAVTPQYFSVLGVPPAIGRAFTEDDGVAGHEGVAILSYGLWQARFGGSDVIGSKLQVDGNALTIVGVMPRGFTLPNRKTDLWTPFPIARTRSFEGGRYLTVVARMKPGVTLTQAQDDMKRVAAQSAIERPKMDEGWSAEVVPMLKDVTVDVQLPLVVLLAAVGFVLLIACANVANLLLMRGSVRMREISVRAALGAGRRRLLQQMLAESLVLAAVASAIGLAGAYWGVKGLVALVANQNPLPREGSIHIDGTVLLFAVGLSLLTAAIFGLAPSFQVSQADPQLALQQNSGRTTSRSVLRQSLVVAEIALSLVLLAGAGLMLRSFHKLLSVNPGFDTSRIMTMGIFTPPSRYRDDGKRAMYFDRVLEQIRAVPGVQQAGTTHFLPLQERMSGSCFELGVTEPVPSRSPGADFLVISPGYLEAMGTRVLSGRAFDARDRRGSPGVVMVNQEFARRFFPGRDPIGQKLNVCWTVQNPVEIVGVTADTRQKKLDDPPRPTIFINNIQSPMYFAQFVVRVSGDPESYARPIQDAIHRVDPDQAVSQVETMDAVLADSVAQPKLQLVLLAFFGAIAGLLSMVGIYGVVAYSAARRTREIGVRVALGALPRDVRRLLLREGLTLGVAGAVIGLAGTLALTRLARGLLFEVEPTDPLALAAAVAAVLAIVVMATLIPAVRAARISPTTALRYE